MRHVSLIKQEKDTYVLTVALPDKVATTDPLMMHGFSSGVLKALLITRWPALESDSKLQKRIVRDLRKLGQDTDVPTIAFTGNGLLNYTTSTAASTAPGLGFGIIADWPDGRRFNMMGTVAQSRDTIAGKEFMDFASTVLVPGIRRFSIMVNYRDLYHFKKNADGSGWGWGTYLNATPMNWKADRYPDAGTADADTTTVHAHVLPITVQFYASRTLLYRKDKDQSCRITMDMGLALKYLGSNTLKADDHRLFLGTTQDLFPGPIVGLGIRYADMHAYFYGTWLFPGNQGHVPGLTGPQLIGGISLSSNLLKLPGGSNASE